MKDRNYKVNIKNIYVGLVQRIDKSCVSICHEFPYVCYSGGIEVLKHNFKNQSFLFEKECDFLLNHSHGCDAIRSMLFTLDENKHADDLLYDSPHYPVFNISTNEDCLNSEICIVNNQLSRLYELLKLFDEYPEEMGYEDILRLRKIMFSCDYAMNHCDKFGIIETEPKETGYGLRDSKGKYRTFNKTVEDFPLGRRYFDSIICTKDYYDSDIESVGNHFTPCEEEEGPIKSLGALKRD